MTIILMRAATSATAAIAADGIKIPPQVTGQICNVGIVGAGMPKLEESVRVQVPFVLDPVNNQDGTDLMPWEHQFHEAAMIECAKKYLRKNDERSGATPPTDETTLDFTAQRIVSHVKEHMILHGLHVYSQKWLFESGRPINDRLSLLRSMADPYDGPQSATTAIATGLMPPLPTYSVPDFVRMLDATWIASGFRVPGKDLRDWIATSQPYLVEFPLPNVASSKSARVDRISRSGGGHRIELGLGFMLVKPDSHFDRINVVTPMLFGGRTAQDSVVKYSKEYQNRQYTPIDSIEHKQLADLLRNPGRTRTAQLQVCSMCGTIFSSGHSGLVHARCTS